MVRIGTCHIFPFFESRLYSFKGGDYPKSLGFSSEHIVIEGFHPYRWMEITKGALLKYRVLQRKVSGGLSILFLNCSSRCSLRLLMMCGNLDRQNRKCQAIVFKDLFLLFFKGSIGCSVSEQRVMFGDSYRGYIVIKTIFRFLLTIILKIVYFLQNIILHNGFR